MTGFKDDKITKATKEEEPKEPFRCHLLLTKELGKIPEKIAKLVDWGELSIVIGKNPRDRAHGQHIFVEGDINDVHDWFRGKKVWVGVGHPQFQEFEQVEYKA